MPLPGGSCGSSGSGSSGLSPGSESDGGSPIGGGVDSMVDGGLGVGGCMGGGGGGGSLGGTLRGVLSRYWSLESLHSTTGKCPAHRHAGLCLQTLVDCCTADILTCQSRKYKNTGRQQRMHRSTKCPSNSDSEPACPIAGPPLSGMHL